MVRSIIIVIQMILSALLVRAWMTPSEPWHWKVSIAMLEFGHWLIFPALLSTLNGGLLVRGTIRLLQGVVAGAILFVVLSPAWREFFLQDVSHRVLLTVLICAAALASLYFEYEVYQLSYGEGA